MNSINYDTELNIYVQIDAVKSVSEYDKNHWVFEGIASTQDIDLYDEVVYPESFLNSIEFFKSNGKIFFDHDYAKANADWLKDHGFSKEEIIALRTPIGKPLDAKVTADGLYIKAVLNKEHPMAKLMWNQYLNNSDDSFRDQIGLSIGAKYLGQPRKEFDVTKGKYVTYLPDLLLYEVSMTPEPVNPKTWASVMKSMMKDASTSKVLDNRIETHIVPSNSVKIESFDDSGNLTIKSLVEGEDGTVYELISTINLKEDVLKAMDEKEKEILENVVEGIEASSSQVSQKAVGEDEEEGQEQPQDQQAQEASPEEEEEGEGQAQPEPTPDMPAEEAPGEQEEEPAEEGEPEESPEEEGEESEGEGDVSSLMDALADQSEEQSDEESEDGSDDAQEMMLDKLDAVLDSLSSLSEMLQSMSPEAPAEEQVTEEAPAMKSIIKEAVEEVLKAMNSSDDEDDEDEEEEDDDEGTTQKSFVDISDESAQKLAETIKSVFSELEESIVEKTTERVLNESTFSVKSVESRENSPVVHPGTRTEGSVQENIENQVLKSVAHNGDNKDFNEEQVTVLKSLVSDYIGIRGHTADKSQQRARVIERAEKELGINSYTFNSYVRKAEKGSF